MKKPYHIRQSTSDEYYWCKYGANGEYMCDSLPETFKTRQGARRAVVQSLNVDMKHINAVYTWDAALIPYVDWKLWAIDETLKRKK